MTDSITPPPELVQQWREVPEFSALSPCVMVTVTNTKLQDIATQAAQWGADQELEACCEWVKMETPADGVHLRAARRPKPPSLKQEALVALNKGCFPSDDEIAAIRRALEALPE
jgi:hypothetical protein